MDVAVEAAGGQDVTFRVEGQRRDETAGYYRGGRWPVRLHECARTISTSSLRSAAATSAPRRAGDYRKLQR